MELEDNEDQVKKVATEFLQEKCHLGPLMFIPGKVLHIEEEKESNERYVYTIQSCSLTHSCIIIKGGVDWMCWA